MENWREKKVTEVKLKTFNDPTFFGDKYIIGTARSVGHYKMLYTNRDIYILVRKQSVYGRTQNLYMNNDWQTEQPCVGCTRLSPRSLTNIFGYGSYHPNSLCGNNSLH